MTEYEKGSLGANIYRPHPNEEELRPYLPPTVPEQEFVTKDLYLAATILAKDIGSLVRVDKADVRHMKFIFSGIDLQEVESAWTNRKVEGNFSDFADSIRKMKSIIHSSD